MTKEQTLFTAARDFCCGFDANSEFHEAMVRAGYSASEIRLHVARFAALEAAVSAYEGKAE